LAFLALTVINQQERPESLLLEEAGNHGGGGEDLLGGHVEAEGEQNVGELRLRVIRRVAAETHLHAGRFQPERGKVKVKVYINMVVCMYK
jgi:hypothetical protein